MAREVYPLSWKLMGELEAKLERDRADGALSAEVVGNVVTVSVAQDPQLIRRGGALWAKVGPYIFVFSDETHTISAAVGGHNQ